MCDVISEIAPRRTGLKPLLIVSGPESIESALESAVNMCRTVRETASYSRLFTKALQMQDTETIILKQDGTILFSTYNQENAASVTQYLKDLVQSPYSLSEKAFHRIEDTLHSIQSAQTVFMEEPCYIFCLEQNPIPVGGGKHGIRFSFYAEMSVQYFNSFYSLTASAKLMDTAAYRRNRIPSPF